MANHRAPRRRMFSRRKPVVPETEFQQADLSVKPTLEDDDYSDAVQEELDEFFENEEPTAAADLQPVTAPVARVVDLAERRPRTTGAELVLMSQAATDAAVSAVYPDGRIENVSCELRVVATLPPIVDGMLLNVTGGGRSAAIAVTRSP